LVGNRKASLYKKKKEGKGTLSLSPYPHSLTQKVIEKKEKNNCKKNNLMQRSRKIFETQRKK